MCRFELLRRIEDTVKQVIAWGRRIEILMYIARVSRGAPFLKTDEKLWDWITNTNLKGVFPHSVSRGGKGEDVAGPATFLA